MKKFREQSPVYTLLTDVGFQIIAVLVLLAVLLKGSLATVSREAKKVPSLEGAVTHLRTDLVRAGSRLREEAENSRSLQLKIEEQRQIIGDQGERIGELTDRLASLQPGGPVDIVVIADCTGSMEPHLARLRNAMIALFDWTPYLASECRVGVLGFRQGVVYRHPLTRIEPAYKDGGRSQRTLMKCLAGLSPQTAPTDHLPAFREAFAMLPEDGNRERKQIVLFLGDVGPCELDNAPGFTPGERERAELIVRGVRTWSAKSSSRVVGSIYVGNEPDAPSSLNRGFFQDLAYPRGSNFSSDSGEIFHVILNAIRPKGSAT